MTTSATRDMDEYRSIWTDLSTTSFRQGFIDAGGIRTRYVQAGQPDAPPLLMLHGTGGSWETFCGNLGPLAQHFNCIAFDMVGSGHSDKPDMGYEIGVYVNHVHAVMKAFGIERASFIGVSLGAWIAARFALTHPQMTDKLVLISPAGLINNAANMAHIVAQRSQAADAPTWDNVKSVFMRLLMEEKSRIDDMVAVRRAIYSLPGAKQATKNVLVLQDPEIRQRNTISEEEWRELSAPVLLIGAVDDPDAYLETAQRLRTLLPNASYVAMHRVGHWGHFEDPVTFNRESLAFLFGR
ncbi:alpha/beta hydrolase [Diaphorobacter sp. HDW4A]|uniref:alpha/beta fold hydrolase n=1 Tax=Diaphorobacter sp. HDW4A TaxID=2714924 RepID=UPI00140B0311|nr:alpha/beta hydrolase [Diaphorobacter sp. HDW4A]QIL79419.1 alpha/beta hydrolase [Diaphorobacter sp. HDW4A]